MRIHLLHLLVPLLCVIGASFTGCVTRTEIEAYTITHRDTAMTDAVHNAPGERDNGVVYPTSREVVTRREVLSHDSTHFRYYPDFLRLGVLELAGFQGTGTAGTTNSYGGGLFGAYGVLDADAGKIDLAHTWTGGLIRILPYEERLRWFRDAPNWTLGTSLAEFIIPEFNFNKSPWSVLPIYFRRRFFLRSEAPYIMVQPTFGVGLAPWQYANIGATVDFGSWGGLNFHAYVGYTAGYRLKILGINDSISRTAGFPYFGLGISVLDFVNTVQETQVEWKDHKHHALEISAVSVDIVHSLSGNKSYFTPATPSVLTGFGVHFAKMDYPLWALDKHVFIGTTLFNIFALGDSVGTMSVLPLRVGYHMVVIPDEMLNQVFVEYNYYPSKFIHIADRFTIDLSNIVGLSINATIGYMTGSEGFAVENSLMHQNAAFSGAYAAVGFVVSEHIFDLAKLTPW